MAHTENKQPETGHKGLSQRKSYNSMVEHSTTTSDLLQSIKMGRQGSKSSTTTASSQQTESSTLSKGSEDDQFSGRPKNFGEVIPGIYRSSYPQEADYPFIQKLGLKTIITLVDKEGHETFVPFMNASNIKHRQIVMAGTKKESIPIEVMASILEVIHDKRNQPVLIHCNQGKHRTGCVIAITRMLQQWDIERIVDEYKAYAHPKIREEDVAYIHKFRLADLDHLEFARPAATAVAGPPRLAMGPHAETLVATSVRQHIVVHHQAPVARPSSYRLLFILALLFLMWQTLEHLSTQRTAIFEGAH